eukprot:TRINITY_DN1104_c0_g2_i1.p1 TRINITY_DN1104_c0_g2~~TRINITY_DN1104_c0_g2_i1.p1  ORF type:complete len:220 (-),score=51.24 TRINITY_DN1104_c0_g2_i1:89-748(-)
MMQDMEEQRPSQEGAALSTLDEPVTETLKRDASRIIYKLFHVLVPRGYSEKALRDWDLWGPLVFCIALALLVGSTKAGQVFVIVSVDLGGRRIIKKKMGGKVSFFQAVCLIGYCVFPLVLAAIVIDLVGIGWKNVWFQFGISLGAFAWSTWASVGFLSASIPDHRRLLAVYPVFLFFLALAWLVFTGIKNGVDTTQSGSKNSTSLAFQSSTSSSVGIPN